MTPLYLWAKAVKKTSQKNMYNWPGATARRSLDRLTRPWNPESTRLIAGLVILVLAGVPDHRRPARLDAHIRGNELAPVSEFSLGSVLPRVVRFDQVFHHKTTTADSADDFFPTVQKFDGPFFP